MIEINRIVPPSHEAFDPEDKSLGFLNMFEFNDLRIQIMEEKAEGYYMSYNGIKLFIDKDGMLPNWPNEFYDLFEKQLNRLLGW